MAFLASLITTIVIIVINAVILTFLSRKFDLGDRSYLTAFIITSILGVFSFLLNFLAPIITVIITIPLGFYLIMWKYRIDWKKALKVWGLFFILSLLAGAIVGALAGLISAPFF